jgi:hypothetical protein
MPGHFFFVDAGAAPLPLRLIFTRSLPPNRAVHT